MSKKDESALFLELGQIIQIIAPSNPDLHEKIYFIDYLDDESISLINDSDLSKTELNIINGSFTDESIIQIAIIAHPDNKGYARQNDLIPDNWISIEFGGDVPTIINGQITDLEEDAIEILIYNTEQKIYIDFGYKGIPKDLPIIDIKPFTPPEEKKEKTPDLDDDIIIDDDDDEDLELIIDNETIKQNVSNLFINVDDIEISDEVLEEVKETVYVEEKNKRFGIETQTQDILDELLAEYPSNKRTKDVVNNIHILIQRFKELRRNFSNFDKAGNAETIKKKGATYKPLIDTLKKLNKNLYWLLPVTRNSHKLFDLEVPSDEIIDDALLTEFRFATNSVMEIFQHYKSNTVPDGQSNYNYLMQNIDNYFTPFVETNNKSNVIIQKNINENIDVLIDNFDNFLSTMVERDQLHNQQYVIDRYNLGLNRLENPDIKNKHSKNIIVPLTNNDSVDLLGFLTLEEPYIHYSKIKLPNTSIYTKSNLHKFNYFYFKILQSNNWNEKIIREGQENTEHDEDIFKHKTYYKFEERRNFSDRQDNSVKEEIYTEFLNNLIPKTKTLFNLIRKYIKNGTSFIKVLEYLEPFLIYNDDISFKQYETITDFIFDEINKHKSTLVKNGKMFNDFIRNTNSYFVETILPKLIKSDYKTIFSKNLYNIDDSLSTEQSLKKMIDIDCGMLYHQALGLTQLTFSQPIDIEEKLKSELEETEDKINEEEKNPSDNCKAYKLVKRYADIEDIQADNNSPVFVDKKYDDTPYDIGEEWKSNNQMTIVTHKDTSETIEMLRSFLIENNGIDPKKAEIDAEAMILGSRSVQEGEYAILDIGNGDIKYYVRQNNIWKYDKDLSGKHIDEVNFCNLKQNCLKIKDSCTNLESSKNMLKNNILDEILDRFENELQLSISKLKSKLLDEYNYALGTLVRLKKVKIQKRIKKDLFQLKIGDQLEEKEIIISPYEEVRNIILSQQDIVKKFNLINRFIYSYCRDANSDEDGNWYYCIDTDVKLLPTFFKTLSEGFFTGRYNETLEIIYKERGVLSSDGDKWVDKHSGYYISEINFDTSEGYDKSGYKIKTNEVMEETMSDKLKNLNIKETTNVEYTTVLAKILSKMISSFDKKLYISTKDHHNFVLKITIESINTNVPDENEYRELYAIQVKKGKKPKTYEKKYDEILLYSLICSYIVAVQSSIPNIITKKSYGNCEKSFSGFPIDGNSDLSFITYFNCMLFNLRRNDRPWNIIPKALTAKSKNRKKNYQEIMDKFNDKIKKFMDEKILVIDEVRQQLNLKKEWNKENRQETIIEEEFNVQKWTSFLPPLVPVTVTRLNNIATTFENMLKDRIKEGSYEQFSHLWSLYGKIVSYSFSIIESVQRAINKEPLVLETKNGIPFLENACCNEGEPNTKLYFSQKEKTIDKHNKIIHTLEELYYRYKNITKPFLFNITSDTKVKYPPISMDFSKETVYLAFIKYCKFNTGIQLDDELKRVCIDNNADFKNTDLLDHKIVSMEANNLNYNKDTLNILLNIINRRNVLHYDLDPPITTDKLLLEQTVEYLLNKNDLVVCDRQFLQHLKSIADRFSVSIEGKDDDITRSFTNYLDAKNEELSSIITAKMLEHKQLSRAHKDLLMEYSQEGGQSTAKIKQKKQKFILNWELIGDNSYMSLEDETGFKIFRMLKEFVTNICKVYPNIILNKVKFNERYVPKHWLRGSKKFSDKHKNDILQFMLKDGEGFPKFYDDNYIKSVLKYVLNNSEDIILLINCIPFYSGILHEKRELGSIFDGEILKKIGYYLLLCSFSLYISSFSQNLNIDAEEKTRFIEDAEEEDIDIIMGEREQIERTTCDLLSVYLQKIHNSKKMLNTTAEIINKNVLKAKTKEKEQIVKRLGDLTVEQREIEDILKNSSLGEWALGRTKAIFEYDENQYDKERNKMEQDALLELQSGGLDDVSEFSGEIFNLSGLMDTMEQNDVERRINAEIYNLDGLAEDDDFGERDGDNLGDYN